MAPEYFTLAELRALPQMADTTVYTDARCEAAAAYVVGVIERECETSFVARTVTGEVHDGGRYELFLRKPWALSVTSATENGVTVTDTLRLKDQRVLRYSSAASFAPKAWVAGFDNITVTYQAGYSSTPPGDLKEAALRATRAYLLESNSNGILDDRRSSLNTETGTINYTIAGTDSPFGYPVIDAVIVGWRNKVRETPA